MKLHDKKTSLLILSVISIILIILTITLLTNNQTPYQYLKRYNKGEIIAPSEILHQERLDTGIIIVFYINQHGKYDCGILEDTLFGYRHVGYSGSLDIDNTETYLYGTFENRNIKQAICWGIIIDNNISEVFLDNETCYIVETEHSNFRIFWLTGFWEELPLVEFVS